MWGDGQPVPSVPVLTRRQLRDRERAALKIEPTNTGSVRTDQLSLDSGLSDSEPTASETVMVAFVSDEPVGEEVVAEIVEAAITEAQEPVAAPIAPVAPVVPMSSYSRLLDSIEPALPRTRAEARRRRDAASLDTVAIDISTIVAGSDSSAASIPCVPAAPAAATGPQRAADAVQAATVVMDDAAAAASHASEQPTATEAPAPELFLPRSSRTLAASAVSAAQPRASKRERPASTRRVAAKLFSGAVMAIVALMAVATSVPADALLTAEDVQAAQLMAVQQTTPGSDEPVQSVAVAAGTDSITIARDGYESSTVAEVAVASGIRMEATFTNNPNGTVQWPFAVGVHIGDQFGFRDCAGCSSNHGGQDFNPGDGAPIQSIADGVVVLAEDGEGSLGVHMIIEHQINGATVASVYAHMQHGTMQFATGDIVKVGQIIGNTGTTGMSTGPHLHFEIRLGGMNGVKTDPLQWLYANTK